jgi:hypothetical protein
MSDIFGVAKAAEKMVDPVISLLQKVAGSVRNGPSVKDFQPELPIRRVLGCLR